MKFSERKGYKLANTLVQTEGMSDELRISLWNVFFISSWDIESAHNINEYEKVQSNIENFSKLLWFSYLKKPIDSRPNNFSGQLKEIRNYFMQCEWYEAYDFVEFALNFYNDDELTKFVNAILEKELSGHRFISGIITEITEPQEVEMLELVLKDTDFPAVKAHLHRALELLSNKKMPDYRNSIKESISAVESLARVLSGNPKATLGDALKTIEKKGKVHPSLKEAFSKLYGYTNDEGGIRHAMLDEPDLSAADARFFLLSCTSFINYLKSKA